MEPSVNPQPHRGNPAPLLAESEPDTGIDSLTGLPTESVFKQRLQQSLEQARTANRSATLALMQLANFYQIRSWVGVAEAGMLLSDIARMLEKSLPETALACRCEHFEFALLLENENSSNAPLITERVKAALQSAVSSAIPPQLTLRCNVGLTPIDPQVPAIDVLFARARHNINQAHPHHRQYLSLQAEARDQLLLTIRQALRNDGWRLNYQPLLNLQADESTHYEVRATLIDQMPRVAMQSVFELATRNAIGEAIDRWVLSQLLAQLQANQSWRDHCFTVNLTLNSLVSGEFTDWFARALGTAAVSPARLILQISEIDALIAQHHLQQFSKALYQLGVKLSISHFACTSDPFAYLPLLRVRQVKLDHSHCRDLQVKTEQRKQLQQLTQRLQQDGIRVVAGNIEDIALLPLLWKLHFSTVQGHCVQPPAPQPDFAFPVARKLGRP